MRSAPIAFIAWLCFALMAASAHAVWPFDEGFSGEEEKAPPPPIEAKPVITPEKPKTTPPVKPKIIVPKLVEPPAKEKSARPSAPVPKPVTKAAPAEAPKAVPAQPPKVEVPKVTAPKAVEPAKKTEPPKPATPSPEPPKTVVPAPATKIETPKPEPAKPELPEKMEPAKSIPLPEPAAPSSVIKPEPPKVATTTLLEKTSSIVNSIMNTVKGFFNKTEPSKEEPPKAAAPPPAVKTEPPKVEPPKAEPPKTGLAKLDAVKKEEIKTAKPPVPEKKEEVLKPVEIRLTKKAPEAKAASGTIAGVLIGKKDFVTLAGLLEASGYMAMLKHPGNFTLFAPTDAAFAKLSKPSVADLHKPENADLLKSVIGYHLLNGNFILKNVSGKKASPNMLQGEVLVIDGTSHTVKAGNANITSTDAEPSNGIIYVLDTVLIPPSMKK